MISGQVRIAATVLVLVRCGMTTATVTSKFQITIPEHIRREMSLSKGDQIGFERTATGWVLLHRPAKVVKSDGAAAKHLKNCRSLSVQEMKDAAAHEAARAGAKRRRSITRSGSSRSSRCSDAPGRSGALEARSS